MYHASVCLLLVRRIFIIVLLFYLKQIMIHSCMLFRNQLVVIVVDNDASLNSSYLVINCIVLTIPNRTREES